VWLAAVAVLPAGLLWWGVSVPGGYHDLQVTALVIWSLLGVAWLASVVARMRPAPVEEGQSARWAKERWPLLLVPVVFAVSWAVASGDLVGRAAFDHERDRMRQWAERQGDPTQSGDLHVGVYEFAAIYRHQGCRFFVVSDPAVAKSSGFAFCPGRDPRNDTWGEGEAFQAFVGDWYTFLVRFGLWKNRFEGADPWGIQPGEINSVTPV
jgi:hypothetical protein